MQRISFWKEDSFPKVEVHFTFWMLVSGFWNLVTGFCMNNWVQIFPNFQPIGQLLTSNLKKFDLILTLFRFNSLVFKQALNQLQSRLWELRRLPHATKAIMDFSHSALGGRDLFNSNLRLSGCLTLHFLLTLSTLSHIFSQ